MKNVNHAEHGNFGYSTRGFTMVEMVVTVGIIAIISAVVARVFFTSSTNSTKSDLLRSIKQNGDFALESMTRTIQNAKTITSACDGSLSTSLGVENSDQGVITFGCALDGTITRIASTSAVTQYLTSSTVTMGGTSCANSGLSFRCTSRAGLPTKVQINFTLSQVGQATKGYEQASVPFQTTVTLRNR